MWIGIDPGQSGGVAMVRAGSGELVAYMRMPMIALGKRPCVDTAALSYWCSQNVGRGIVSGIVIEQVASMPRQGVASSFNFGRHAGAVEGWALSKGCRIVMQPPSSWKRKLGLSRDKQGSLDMARQAFGDLSVWKVKANDGIAEAALLALHFGARPYTKQAGGEA